MLKTKQIAILFLISCILFVFCGCSTSEETGRTSDNAVNSSVTSEQETSHAEEGKAVNGRTVAEKNEKVLIAYFFRRDENYDVGYIEKGNTEIIAEMISQETGGELFHIERDEPYPAEYNACTDEAKKEQSDNARPELALDKDISEYTVIFLGFPIWWSDCPMPVYTFLEGHDFSRKTIIPFCTHAGSGLSGTKSSIEKTCVGADVADGFAITGAEAQNSQKETKKAVQEWLKEIEY